MLEQAVVLRFAQIFVAGQRFLDFDGIVNELFRNRHGKSRIPGQGAARLLVAVFRQPGLQWCVQSPIGSKTTACLNVPSFKQLLLCLD
ncbi:hypothetical protein D9M72_234380 [compost metagenome]